MRGSVVGLTRRARLCVGASSASGCERLVASHRVACSLVKVRGLPRRSLRGVLTTVPLAAAEATRVGFLLVGSASRRVPIGCDADASMVRGNPPPCLPPQAMRESGVAGGAGGGRRGAGAAAAGHPPSGRSTSRRACCRCASSAASRSIVVTSLAQCRQRRRRRTLPSTARYVHATRMSRQPQWRQESTRCDGVRPVTISSLHSATATARPALPRPRSCEIRRC